MCRIRRLSDRILSNESFMFPPKLWAEVPCNSKRTNNSPESVHANYNEQFYSCDPAIHDTI